MKPRKNAALLLAAGKGSRFGGEKLFAPLCGKPVFLHSLELLEKCRAVHEIFITANAQNIKRIKVLVRETKCRKVKKILVGGKTRFQSVKKGVVFAQKMQNLRHLIIHNAANPCATESEIMRCLSAFRGGISGVAVGRPVSSTLKKVMRSGASVRGVVVAQTLAREDVWETETPQAVRAKEFFTACKRAKDEDFTDDLSVLEAAGMKTKIIEADFYNRKITTPSDLEMMERVDGFGKGAVGIGEDSHKFLQCGAGTGNSSDKNRCLVLGGVKIKNLPPLEADSDGDVILHALCNALSSALGEGSLGTYATKMRRTDGVRDSKKYLQKILALMKRRHYRIHNCAFSIEAARPKIDPLVPLIKKGLSALLHISVERIGITATSGEKLTSFGRGKAVRCTATVLLH